MVRTIILRPEPGATATLRAAQALGLDAQTCPLFEVRPLDWIAPPPGMIDALLLGSANAVRHAGPQLDAFRQTPVYAVGKTTAHIAREAGLNVVMTGSGGLQSVLERLDSSHSRILRLSGRERVELDAPARVSIITQVVYASIALPLPPALSLLLREPAVVLLHSGEAAARLDMLTQGTGVNRAAIALAAIGPRVAARAGSGWSRLDSAASPDDTTLLALAAQMCQEMSLAPKPEP